MKLDKDNPFLTDEDIKEVMNRMKNFQESSRHNNASKKAISETQEGIQQGDIGKIVKGLKAQMGTGVLLTGRAVKNAAGAVTERVKTKAERQFKRVKRRLLLHLLFPVCIIWPI